VRYPITSAVKFRSQCSNNIGEKKELTGSLLIRSNQTVNGNPGSWNNLIDKTEDNQKTFCYNKE